MRECLLDKGLEGFERNVVFAVVKDDEPCHQRKGCVRTASELTCLLHTPLRVFGWVAHTRIQRWREAIMSFFKVHDLSWDVTCCLSQKRRRKDRTQTKHQLAERTGPNVHVSEGFAAHNGFLIIACRLLKGGRRLHS